MSSQTILGGVLIVVGAIATFTGPGIIEQFLALFYPIVVVSYTTFTRVGAVILVVGVVFVLLGRHSSRAD